MTLTIPLTGDYLEFSRRLRQLHTLIRRGKGDSDEAESIRDEMDVYYRRLSPAEIERLDLLSADLNSIGDPPLPGPVRIFDEGEVQDRFREVGRERDPDIVRSYLASVPDDPDLTAFIRLAYWAGLGEFESARPFAQFMLDRMGRDLEEEHRRVTKESEEILRSIARPGEIDLDDLRRRAGHACRSMELFNSVNSSFAHLSGRIGSTGVDPDASLTEGAMPADPGTSAQEFKDSFAALISGMTSIRRVA